MVSLGQALVGKSGCGDILCGGAVGGRVGGHSWDCGQGFRGGKKTPVTGRPLVGRVGMGRKKEWGKSLDLSWARGPDEGKGGSRCGGLKIMLKNRTGGGMGGTLKRGVKKLYLRMNPPGRISKRGDS